MKKIFLSVISIALLFVFLYPLFSNKEIRTITPEPSITLEYHVFPVNVDEGWGYEISNGDRVVIKQNQIPAMEGNSSFKTQKDAENVAKLVLNKIKMNETPSVTKEELRQLKIIE